MKIGPSLLDPSAVWSSMEPKAIPSTLPVNRDLRRLVAGAHRVLDVGCGCGQLATEFALRNCDWVGMDVNEAAIKSANGLALHRAQFFVADILHPWNGRDGFDLVILKGVLTCMPCASQRATALRNAKSLMAARGTFYLSDFLLTPSEACHASRYQKGIEAGLDRGSFPVDAGDGSILYIAHHLLPDEIVELVNSVGFVITGSARSRGQTRTGKPIDTMTLTAK